MPINQTKNRQTLDGLIQALQRGETVALTGAGLSVWAGYATWAKLIDRLAAAVQDHRGNQINVQAVRAEFTNLLHCARRLGNDLGPPAFDQFVLREFGPTEQPPHLVINRFVSIGWKHILTLNFEESLERAHTVLGFPHNSVTCADRRQLTPLFRSLTKSNGTRQIGHLHGKFTDPINTIALTEDGYRALYRDAPLYTDLLWALFTMHTVCFVGFGFSDSDFMRYVQDAARDTEICGSCHFAIIGLRQEQDDEATRRRFHALSINPLFYEVTTVNGIECHDEFVALIERIAEVNRGNIQAPAPPAIGRPPDADDVQTAQRLTDILLRRIDQEGPNV